jgi:hypothetical protein
MKYLCVYIILQKVPSMDLHDKTRGSWEVWSTGKSDAATLPFLASSRVKISGHTNLLGGVKA